MIKFKYFNAGAIFNPAELENEDIAFVEDTESLYTHGKEYKFGSSTQITEITDNNIQEVVKRASYFLVSIDQPYNYDARMSYDEDNAIWQEIDDKLASAGYNIDDLAPLVFLYVKLNTGEILPVSDQWAVPFLDSHIPFYLISVTPTMDSGRPYPLVFPANAVALTYPDQPPFPSGTVSNGNFCYIGANSFTHTSSELNNFTPGQDERFCIYGCKHIVDNLYGMISQVPQQEMH